MSIVVNKNHILLTRGDSARLKINLMDDRGNALELQDGDTIRFAMKKDYSDEYPVILKQIPISTMELYLVPKDTKSLEMPSEYVYDIEINYANGEVDTVARGKFTIMEEVY